MTWPYIRRDDWWRGAVYYEPVARDRCWKCCEPTPDLAHSVLEYVGGILAEPLRKAFEDHLDAHGCAERHGFAYCDEAMRLFRLLPAGDQVIIA